MQIIEIIKSNKGLFDSETNVLGAIIKRLHPAMESGHFTGLDLTEEQAQATLEFYELLDVAELTGAELLQTIEDTQASLLEIIQNGGISCGNINLMHGLSKVSVLSASRSHSQIAVLRQSVKAGLDEYATKRRASKSNHGVNQTPD